MFLINKKRAFTLIELLVVVAIIGILASVVLAALTSARDKGRLAAGRQFEANAYHTLGDQTLAMWSFDECSGGAIDSSGYGNNGTLTGGAVFNASDTAKSRGCSITFDGVDDYITVGTDLKFRGDVELSASAWFKPTGANNTNFPAIVDFQSAPASCAGLYFTVANNRPSIDFDGHRWRTTSAISQNDWHQVTVVKKPGLISTTSKIYVDGKEAPSALESSDCTPNVAAPGGGGLVIGRLTHTGAYVAGLIDEVRVFAKALTAREVGAMYASGLKTREFAEK